MITFKNIKYGRILVAAFMLGAFLALFVPMTTSAQSLANQHMAAFTCPKGGTYSNDAGIGCKAAGKYQCGTGDDAIKTSINFGCKGQGNAMVDVTFAIIRFLTNGVGLVIVASMVYGGIQYIMARDDPSAVTAARGRIQNSLIALLVFIFAYAMLNYVIPNGFFK